MDVPALLPVGELVGLDRPLGELVLVLLVVVDAQQPLGVIALDTTRATSESSPLAVVIWSPSSAGSWPSASTIFWRAEESEPSGRCSPIRSIAAASAFASSGSSRAGRAKLSP